MPWTVSDPPPSYKGLSGEALSRAVAIANAMLREGADEGEAIATGIARARQDESKAELFKRAYKRAGVKGLDQPKMTPKHPTKKGIVVTSVRGRPKTIRFGDQSIGHNYSPEARKAFKSRHAKNIARGKSSAAYWANRELWKKGGRSRRKDAPMRHPELEGLSGEALARATAVMDERLRQGSMRADAADAALRRVGARQDAPLSSGARSSLPDSAFLYIAPGGKKDETGRTVPRSLRKLPVYGPNGRPSASHIRNALSRLGQSKTDIPASARAEVRRKAERMLEQLR